MYSVPRARRHNFDHVSALLNKSHNARPAPDFSKRNYKAILDLQAETQRRRTEQSAEKPPAFKMSRFASVGALVFEKQKQLRSAEIQRTASLSSPVKLKVKEEPQAQQARSEYYQQRVDDVARLPPQEPATHKPEPPETLPPVAQEPVHKSPASPSKPGFLAAVTARKVREDEELRCPAGMRILQDEEQHASLEKLQEEKRLTIVALNKVQLASTTPSVVKLRRDLEHKLVDLEKSIEVFSRKRVYVRA